MSKSKLIQDFNNQMIEKIVIDNLVKAGIIVEVSNEEDVDLTEYGIDSITFISFIVDLEESLDASLPDDLLNYDILKSLKGFINLISQCVNC